MAYNAVAQSLSSGFAGNADKVSVAWAAYAALLLVAIAGTVGVAGGRKGGGMCACTRVLTCQYALVLAAA